MVGPFKRTKSGLTHLLTAIDKFTKWMKGKPNKKLYGPTATIFLKEVIFQYCYLHNITTDNSSNFVKGDMAEFRRDKGI
jgi:hypothetical protein